MSRIFLVQFNFNVYLFSEENFYKFIERNSNKGWTFLYGEVDSNMPLKSPKDIKPNELKKEFNLNKGDLIVVTGGFPVGEAKRTNYLRIIEI